MLFGKNGDWMIKLNELKKAKTYKKAIFGKDGDWDGYVKKLKRLKKAKKKLKKLFLEKIQKKEAKMMKTSSLNLFQK